MDTSALLLGVNIDHVATLRQARGTVYPRPVDAALLAEQNGADSITVHLREDRRHIQDTDIRELKTALQTRMNLEMAITDEMVGFAAEIRPADCCFVPERREEVTTEGGLDVISQLDRVQAACRKLGQRGIRVAVFIDPEAGQLDAAKQAGVGVVELHTGTYADADPDGHAIELEKISKAARYGSSIGLTVHAGHGLHYGNVQEIAALPEIAELNIGHSIVAQSVYVGLAQAVGDMKKAMLEARRP
jgi:pyridoxine 5-phosphate synthase